MNVFLIFQQYIARTSPGDSAVMYMEEYHSKYIS